MELWARGNLPYFNLVRNGDRIQYCPLSSGLTLHTPGFPIDSDLSPPLTSCTDQGKKLGKDSKAMFLEAQGNQGNAVTEFTGCGKGSNNKIQMIRWVLKESGATW